MNKPLGQEKISGQAWEASRNIPDIPDMSLLVRWETATKTIKELAEENGWSKSEVSRRSEIAIGTFSQWYDGTYKGRWDTTTAKVERYIQSVENSKAVVSGLPELPEFLETPTSKQLFTAFTYAQMLPTMSVVTVGSGMGKSHAAREYKRKNPHVFHVEMSPSASKSEHMMMLKISESMNISIPNANKVEGAILKTVQKNGINALLIIDEAQNLSDPLINQLRHFQDVAECGLVLLGNDEATTPYAGSKLGAGQSPQIFRRIGHRMLKLAPCKGDIDIFVNAWGIKDPKAKQLAARIAMKPGALGTLRQTIFLASMIARGYGREITRDDMVAAWNNRGAGAL